MKSFFLPAISLALLVSCSVKDPILSVEGGKVQGIPDESCKVVVFKGVPYAAPPVGELRWKAPAPVVPWEGIRLADTFSPIAPQQGNPPGTFYGDEFYWEGTPAQSEDCLYLNVWAPASSIGKPRRKLPVAMWIHGGAYVNGYGHEVTMDGTEWARRGVILVTINYRLGVLGFLTHPLLSDEQGGHSGNYGTMDQIAALRWIRDNIAQFGGDPDNITIFGQSAGAMSVKTLCESPLCRGLISGAIIQSGGGISGVMQPLTYPEAYYEMVGKAVMDEGGFDTLEKMREASYEDLYAAQVSYMTSGKGRATFSPHVDGVVVTDDFGNAAIRGTIADIPYLIGYNKDDMGMLAGDSVHRFCAVRDSLGGAPVFEYEFLRNLPGDDDDPAKDPGAFHSAELWYTFGTLDRSWRPFTKQDHALSEEMLDAWTSFCREGDPHWTSYTRSNPYRKEFDIR